MPAVSRFIERLVELAAHVENHSRLGSRLKTRRHGGAEKTQTRDVPQTHINPLFIAKPERQKAL
jgi:hypothetical protein